jgi:hypothetical protein
LASSPGAGTEKLALLFHFGASVCESRNGIAVNPEGSHPLVPVFSIPYRKLALLCIFARCASHSSWQFGTEIWLCFFIFGAGVLESKPGRERDRVRCLFMYFQFPISRIGFALYFCEMCIVIWLAVRAFAGVSRAKT